MSDVKPIHIQIEMPGRDEIDLHLELSGEAITKGALKGVGGPQLLALLVEWRPKLKGSLSDLEVPTGMDPSSILMREVILKAKGEWDFPYKEEETCHCRAVPTNVVDMAIVTGAHTPEKVSALTSASTACGTCRADVESMIEYRLGKKSEKKTQGEKAKDQKHSLKTA